MNRNELFQLFKTSFQSWQHNNDSLRAAALTFFIILPLPSILLIVEAVFALFYGPSQATQIVIQQVSSFAGPAVAELFRTLITSESSPFASAWSAFTVVAFSLGGAIGAFAVLRDTLNLIWGFKSERKREFTRWVGQKVGPFLVVSALGLIIIAWTGVAAVLSKTVVTYSINKMLTAVSLAIVQILSLFGLALLLFALIYKIIPDVKIHWSDVWLAALVTGVAFTVTNYAIGTYVENFTVTTVIGAGGALLIILLWIFIVTQIILFGGEVSKVYATTVGRHSKEYSSLAADRNARPFERTASGRESEEEKLR